LFSKYPDIASLKDIKDALYVIKREIRGDGKILKYKFKVENRDVDKIAKTAVELSLKSGALNDLGEFTFTQQSAKVMGLLTFLKNRHKNHWDGDLKKWINKDISTFKDSIDLGNHLSIHDALIEEDNNGYATLPSEKKSKGKEFKSINDLPTEATIAGYVIKRLDSEDQIPTQEWVDLECDSKYCITTKNYFGEYGGPPYFWVLKQNGDKFIQKGMIIPGYFDSDLKQALRNDKNTRIMEDSLIKELMPFLVKHNILETSPRTIKYIENPSEEVRLKAVKRFGYVIQYIDNPSEAVQVEAVKNKGNELSYIDSPSQGVQFSGWLTCTIR